MKDCDPVTGEPDDEQGFDDEYVVSILTLYILGYFWIFLFVRGNTLCQFWCSELVQFLTPLEQSLLGKLYYSVHWLWCVLSCAALPHDLHVTVT